MPPAAPTRTLFAHVRVLSMTGLDGAFPHRNQASNHSYLRSEPAADEQRRFLAIETIRGDRRDCVYWTKPDRRTCKAAKMDRLRDEPVQRTSLTGQVKAAEALPPVSKLPRERTNADSSSSVDWHHSKLHS
jgi:hypothetical protein